MRISDAKGFSIIEILVVCAIAGIVASIAVPHLQKAIRAAEAGGTYATMRSVSSTQMSYFTTNGRFARITEINNIMSGGVGTTMGTDVVRSKFVLSNVPAAPTDLELRSGYTITATRNVAGEGQIYLYEMTQTGEIRQVLP